MVDFLISPAWAQEAPPGGGFQLLIMVGIFFLIMYFLLIRPQQKRTKEHNALITSLSKSDEVITTGGILGRVTAVSDSFISLEIQSGTTIKVQKQSIQSMVPKGTINSG